MTVTQHSPVSSPDRSRCPDHSEETALNRNMTRTTAGPAGRATRDSDLGAAGDEPLPSQGPPPPPAAPARSPSERRPRRRPPPGNDGGARAADPAAGPAAGCCARAAGSAGGRRGTGPRGKDEAGLHRRALPAGAGAAAASLLG